MLTINRGTFIYNPLKPNNLIYLFSASWVLKIVFLAFKMWRVHPRDGLHWFINEGKHYLPAEDQEKARDVEMGVAWIEEVWQQAKRSFGSSNPNRRGEQHH
ncbi:hypothetical protein M427DRAFT_153940 [Gonapodya prolifera JEL478]|uniref:Uncharacterized protein n=1 Tax=Gonapodya prolifera (strain JEL478) TaxID=1344416 RepID=A0A139AL06_GONPJ|nr:hypothetical protein M427DRAFT_153940 [Gonapodya prolifera JEL478]|eukprot:KXS17105.1 hypothetical protein M427DRAFT_153940 [Gonapodya prolifera JEL478]